MYILSFRQKFTCIRRKPIHLRLCFIVTSAVTHLHTKNNRFIVSCYSTVPLEKSFQGFQVFFVVADKNMVIRKKYRTL